MFYDLSEDALAEYKPEVDEPDDLDAFWAQTLDESRSLADRPAVDPVNAGLKLVEVHDVTFSGFGGDPIKGWLDLPVGIEPRAVVVELNGYNGGRGLPHERIGWSCAGYAHFFMDTRGQGAGWGSGGDTWDPEGSGPAVEGYMTRGIQDPRRYYYRRLITDSVLAVDAVRALPQTAGLPVIVHGVSQGGGLTLAVSGLASGLAAVLPDVPFGCNPRRGVAVTDSDPFHELTNYLAVHRDDEEIVWRTLSYHDPVNLAKRADAPALFSAGLMDPVCPPSTVWSAFNWYGDRAGVTDKRIDAYRYNGHEGGEAYRFPAHLAWLNQHLA